GREYRLAAELPFVGAALADLVDHASVGAAELGAVATNERLLLLDRSIGQVEATQVGQRFAGEITVDVVGVLGHARATERHQAPERVVACSAGNGAGGQQCDGLGGA